MRTLAAIVQRYTYRKRNYSAAPDPALCAAQVRSASGLVRQCTRRPVTKLAAVCFCRQHATKIERQAIRAEARQEIERDEAHQKIQRDDARRQGKRAAMIAAAVEAIRAGELVHILSPSPADTEAILREIGPQLSDRALGVSLALQPGKVHG